LLRHTHRRAKHPLTCRSTAALAGAQPLEKDVPSTQSLENEKDVASVQPVEHEKDVPGAFPETPAPLSSQDEQAFSINPIPASEGAGNPVSLAAGEKVPEPSTLHSNNIESGVHDDPELKAQDTFSVAPIPASEGVGNPVSLAAGEKVPEPSSLHNNTIDSGVHDDPELKAQDTFSVAPIPASAGTGNPVSLAAGEKVPEPSTLHSNTIESGVHDDPELKAQDELNTYSVAPIPATAGTGNPIHLEPGEPVPHHSTLTANTVESSVKLDKASYEKSDSGAPQLPPVLTPGSEQEAFGAQPVFSGLGPVLGGAFIPESSLPMGEKAVSDVGPTISSVAPQSTTAELAGQQPIITRGVPEVVAESQEQAHVSPEAAANPEAVLEKNEVEKELKQKVTEEPAISSVAPESTTNELAGQQPVLARGVPEVVAESQEQAHVSPEAAANPEAVQEKSEFENELKQKVAEEPAVAESSGVPQIVEESQEKAHASPEAAANPEAVQEKAEFEEELKQKVPEEPATTESGLLGNSERGITGAIAGGAIAATAAAGTAAAAGAYALRQKATETTGKDPVASLPKSVQDTLPESVVGGATTSANTDAAGLPLEPATVPHVVEESQEKAHVEPEAAANPEAVVEKADVEEELKKKVPEAPATAESGLLGKSESNGGVTGAVAGGAVATGAAAAAGVYAVNQKVTETTGTDAFAKLPKSVQDSINSMNSKGTTAPETTSTAASTVIPDAAISQDRTLPQQTAIGEPVTVPAELDAPKAASGVPEEVVHSQQEAHVSPEAAANPEAVQEKEAMEKELQSAVKPVEASGEPAPTVTAATSATAPTTSASGAPQLADPAAVSPISVENETPTTGAAVLPNGKDTLAGAAPVALADKTNLQPATGSKELNASADTPATTDVQKNLAAPEPATQLDSRDVSPMSRVATKNHPEGSEGTETGPIVTDGINSTTVPAESKAETSAAPAESAASKPVGSRPDASNSTTQKRASFMDRVKGTSESTKTSEAAPSASGAESQKKRRSFFGRIKDKLLK
jgi:hypothetical protein